MSCSGLDQCFAYLDEGFQEEDEEERENEREGEMELHFGNLGDWCVGYWLDAPLRI